MTKGEGLVALLYAVKDMLETFAMMFVMALGFLAFFWIIIKFVGQKAGLGGHGGWGGGKKVDSKVIMYALFVLFVMVSLYSLIALTAAVFGVNSSPTGGLLIR
jgi:hypothetical protein